MRGWFGAGERTRFEREEGASARLRSRGSVRPDFLSHLICGPRPCSLPHLELISAVLTPVVEQQFSPASANRGKVKPTNLRACPMLLCFFSTHANT